MLGSPLYSYLTNILTEKITGDVIEAIQINLPSILCIVPVVRITGPPLKSQHGFIAVVIDKSALKSNMTCPNLVTLRHSFWLEPTTLPERLRLLRQPDCKCDAPTSQEREEEDLPLIVMCIFIDDVYVTGKDDDQHLVNLEKNLKRIEEQGVILRKEKCAFLRDEVFFLGPKSNKGRIQPVQEEVEAIRAAPNPQNVSERKSFLGMLNCYSTFLPNDSAKLAPLYRFVQKDVKWRRKKEDRNCFDQSKPMLTSDKLIVQYDPKKQLVINYDVSAYGVGAVPVHKLEKNPEHPIAYAS
ncbi:polyprotein [Plakobranchus ocellatus]|uniref:Polyprotein n=1 Tax=Plakobranchus ocellatus TaxID=259542 RepID=A0AAV4BNB9_9GAST|nr:polyprotein [Plakobranchus ocellatus]